MFITEVLILFIELALFKSKSIAKLKVKAFHNIIYRACNLMALECALGDLQETLGIRRMR